MNSDMSSVFSSFKSPTSTFASGIAPAFSAGNVDMFATIKPTQSEPTSSLLFGKPKESAIALHTKPLFSGVTSTPGGTTVFASKNQPSASIFGGSKTDKSKTPSIFGGTGLQQKTAGSTSFRETAGELPGTSSKITSPGLFGTKETGHYESLNPSPTGTGLFTMKRQPKPASPQKTPGSGLFGKVSTDSLPLFGKYPPIEDKREKLDRPDVSIDKGAREKNLDESPVPTLFGKPVSLSHSLDVDSNIGEKKSLIRRPIKSGKSALSFGSEIAGKIVRRSKSIVARSKDEPSPDKPRRRLTSDDITSKDSIVVKGLPAGKNEPIFLKSYFRKFGEVVRCYPNLNKKYATIHFKTHEDAAKAKKSVTVKGIPGTSIFWGTHNLKKQASTATARFLTTAGTYSDDVNDELKGMMTSDDQMRLLERPTEMTRPLSRSSESPTPSSSFSQRSKSSTGGGAALLGGLRNSVGFTANERCAILDNRDKFVRQGIKKEVDLSKAKATIGTCPDMCPEKERYLREDRRRLHLYEMIPGTEQSGQMPKCDHSRAVKEYSRSSADQEEPLPHELRPPQVLAKTMNYLMNHIMDRGGDGMWSDWYDFLWNRTRGIRKDITQQHLCDLTSVEVVEKCARFHIFCAERLCEEDMMTFDAKINNENLTKCLQTLKELYHDLDMKQNIHCPNEAEFRGYTVLMNLNQGDTLREVQTLRDEIRESSFIKFALSAYEAINSNNYVRFFKLVRKASFLSACIMHRYFNQVRDQAVMVMLRAFKPIQFPAQDFARMLAFDGEDDLENFCNHHRIQLEYGTISCDRANYSCPESAFVPCRSKIIEEKLTCSVGEIVNGGRLPGNFIPQPSSSFDEQGRFIEQLGGSDPSAYVEDREFDSTVKPIQTISTVSSTHEQQFPVQSTSANRLLELYSNESINQEAKELFREIIAEFCHEVSSSAVKAADIYLSQAHGIMESIVNEVSDALSSEVGHVFHEAEAARKKEEEQVRVLQKRLMEKKLREERERDEMISKMTDELFQEVIDSVIVDGVHDVAQKQYKLVKFQLNEESKQRSTDLICNKIVDDVVGNILGEVASERYSLCLRKEGLEKIGRQVHRLRLFRFYKRWQTCLSKCQRAKRVLQEFPAAPCMKTASEQVEDFYPRFGQKQINKRAFQIDDNSSLTINTLDTIEKQNKIWNMKQQLYNFVTRMKREMSWRPLDLPKVVGPILLERRLKETALTTFSCIEDTVYWKLLLFWPGKADEDDLLFNWGKIRFGCTDPETHKSQTDVLTQVTSQLKGKRVQICVRLLCGSTEDMDQDMTESILSGIDGVVLILGTSQSDKVGRISQCISALLPELNEVPVAVLTETAVPHDLLKSVKDELECGIERNVPIYKLGDLHELRASEQLCECLHWLIHHCPTPPQLESRMIRDYIDDGLVKFFFTPLYQNLSARKKKGLLHQPPQLIIDLYQHALEHIAEVVSDADLEALTWPAAEFANKYGLPAFDWNSMDNLEIIKQMIFTLSLPEFEIKDTDSEDWDLAVQDVWKYIKAISYQDPEADKTILYSRISWLLRKVKNEFEDFCFLTERKNDCDPCYVNIPWTEVIVACVEHQVRNFDCCDPTSDREDVEMVVLYKKDAFEKYHLPASWLLTLEEKSEKVDTTLRRTFSRAAKRKFDHSLTENSSDTIKRQQKNVGHQMGNLFEFLPLDPLEVSANETLIELQESIQEEKKEMAEYEKYLQEIVKEGELPLDLSLMRMGASSSIGPVVSRSYLQMPTSIFESSIHSSKKRNIRPEPIEIKTTPEKELSFSEKVDKLMSDINSERRSSAMLEMKLKAAVLQGDFLNKTDSININSTQSFNL
ncbi:germinal-center associated nuclear protein-like [Tubulanus polymorphus]|uniref:germinal-center associated nuclear protein-like n=1 Tax=Tubulanus polymorphus TaxID=672921 RepID=UPI003DA691AC